MLALLECYVYSICKFMLVLLDEIGEHLVEVTEERHDAFEESKAMAMEAFQKHLCL